MEILKYLKSRRLIKQSTEGLCSFKYAYCGFDPTMPSLHIGHLIPLRIMSILRDKFGVQTIAIIGSGTAELGDPTDKTETRRILSRNEIKANADAISNQMQKIGNLSYIVDNRDWFGEMNMLDFMRTVCSQFSVNSMLKMETFRRRIEGEQNLSLMEFLYTCLQAYDFALLNSVVASDITKKLFGSAIQDCIQIGGSDQWGNIVKGVEFVKKISGKSVGGLTTNLLKVGSGVKMGKSISGALYLDPNLVSPYEMYQSIINLSDDCVEEYMYQLTDISSETILKLVTEDISSAKKELAYHIVRLVHGEEAVNLSVERSKQIFEFENTESMDQIDWVWDEKIKLKKLLQVSGIMHTVSDAERNIVSGAVAVNGKKIEDPNLIVEKNKMTVCIGKKKYYYIK